MTKYIYNSSMGIFNLIFYNTLVNIGRKRK